MPGEKRPDPARFAPYRHPRELILPRVYPTLPFPSLGNLSAFLPGNIALGGWAATQGESRSHPCHDLGFEAAETGQHGLPWLSSFLCKPSRRSQQRNRNQTWKMRRLQKCFIGGLLLGTARSPCSCWDLPLLLFAACSSCLSSKKALSDYSSDPWGYYCTMGKAAITAAGCDAEEFIFLLCP